jgi:hypothetical protein
MTKAQVREMIPTLGLFAVEAVFRLSCIMAGTPTRAANPRSPGRAAAPFGA